MRTLAVLCARKGSKRLKDKHWQEINGKPMWAHAFDAARFAKTPLVVSTDDKKIHDSVADHGVVPILRPSELAQDITPIHLVLQHAVNQYASLSGAVAFIPACIPTVTEKLIMQCIRKLERSPKLDSVITVRTVRDHPAWMYADCGGPSLVRANKDAPFYRMQDLPPLVTASGSVCVVRTPVLMACRTSYFHAWLGKDIGYVMDEDAVEVHDARDLLIARAVMGERK